MVGKKKTVKIYIRIFLFLVLFPVIVISCEERSIMHNVDCSECYQEEPDSADLIIDLTINDNYKDVVIKIFEGNIDTGKEIYYDTVQTERYYVYAPVGKLYSVVAIYKDSRGKTINVVDADKLKTRYIYDTCDEDCYVIKGGVFDVSLKY